MERLTRIDWKKMAPMECCGQKDYCIRRREVENACLNCIVPKLYVRVAAYEDAGLSPEGVAYAVSYLNSTSMAEIKGFEGVPFDRLQELAVADKEGRAVVLPPDGYTWKIRGDLVRGIITANCKAAESERVLEVQVDGNQ